VASSSHPCHLHLLSVTFTATAAALIRLQFSLINNRQIEQMTTPIMTSSTSTRTRIPNNGMDAKSTSAGPSASLPMSVSVSVSGATSASDSPSLPHAVHSGIASRCLVMDMGGDTIKIGWAGNRRPNKLIPNCAVREKRGHGNRWLVGDLMLPSLERHDASSGALTRVDRISDYVGLQYRRSHDRGMVVNWEVENEVMQRCFHRSTLDPTGQTITSAAAVPALLHECNLLLTMPIATPSRIVKDVDENIVEKWGFNGFRRITTAAMARKGIEAEAMIKTANSATTSSASATSASSSIPSVAGTAVSPSPPPSSPCALVIDSGFSFSHVTPVYDGRPIKSATKRIQVGGKLLTNYLKEITSYRQWNMMDETYIMNDVKEQCCYVSTDFERELNAAKRSRKVAQRLRREYVLPNGSTVLHGYVRDASNTASAAASLPSDDQVLVLGNERFTVPEVLFHPSDVGLNQCGLVECIVHCVESLPVWMQPLMYENILLIGGNMKLHYMKQRIERELRMRIPEEYNIQVTMGEDPIITAWMGGSALCSHSQEYEREMQFVTRKEYEERGSHALTRKWEGDDDEDDGKGEEEEAEEEEAQDSGDDTMEAQ